jgi:hypothetical protein
MADDNKKTIFQNLSGVLDLYGNELKDTSDQKIIIRGKSPQEIQRKALEIEQQNKLSDKFTKLTDHGFQKAMQYEAARLPAYLDYEGMEWMPIIASALDLFMEESTTIGDDGKMLKIYSNKERIKDHLEDFFYNKVNVNVMLPFWTRNLCKYGNNFVYLTGKKGKGITHVKQMVNYEMERIEAVRDGKADIKFKQRETGQDFNTFEMAHFRLLGDDKYLPYGSSVLNKVRRVFRQLIMAEDSMLTYRITRAGEKRVFKIDVGNIDEDDIEEYVQKVMTRFKKQQHVYPDSGQIDYRFNILGVDEDYIMPVRNANTETGIDTLQGAQNLNDINDIEYLRDNLFTGIGIPKPFLGFQQAAGDGKNMAQMDIRFSKKVNRIQQALIQELNKMAMIHLYLLGFDQDHSNFSLALTNPSSQQEILATELLTSKAQVYTELTRNEGGISAMSHTNAKRKIFHMSDREIVEDFKIQRMERAIAQELQDSPLVIRSTGLFTDIDNKYGSGEVPPEGAGMEAGEGGEAGEGMNEPNEPPIDGGGQNPSDLPPVIGQGDGFKPDNPKPLMTEKAFTDHIEEMININKPETKKVIDKSVINEDNKKVKVLNETAIEMTKEIDTLIKKNKNQSISENDINPESFNGKRFLKHVSEAFNSGDVKEDDKSKEDTK